MSMSSQWRSSKVSQVNCRPEMSAVNITCLCFTSGEKQKEEEEEEEDPMDTFYPEALAGFVMVMTEEGDMIYLTENVSKHIGITQVHQSFKKQRRRISLTPLVKVRISSSAVAGPSLGACCFFLLAECQNPSELIGVDSDHLLCSCGEQLLINE